MLHVFPIALTSLFAPLFDVKQVVEFVYVGALQRVFSLFRQGTAPHAVYDPCIVASALGIDGFELHAVGMECGDNFGTPNNLRALFAQHVCDGPICEVPLAGGSQTSVEGYAEAEGCGVSFKIFFSGSARPHGVTAAGAGADAI